MFGQTLQLADLGTIAFLVLLEALLSTDNALILAMLVRHIEPERRGKALFYGLGGAFILRTAAILLAAYIIHFWWLQLIGAAYLVYLPLRHFFFERRRRREGHERREMSFWQTVVYLNLIDTAFALDSVLVAIAVVDTVRHADKIWVVIAGAIIGIIVLRFAANGLVKALEQFPRLDHVAYLLVGWAGIKLLFVAAHSFEHLFDMIPGEIPEVPPLVFWGGMALIATVGSFVAMRRPRPSE